MVSTESYCFKTLLLNKARYQSITLCTNLLAKTVKELYSKIHLFYPCETRKKIYFIALQMYTGKLHLSFVL